MTTASNSLGKRHNSEMKLRFVVSSTKKNKFERQLEQEITFLQRAKNQSNSNSKSNTTHSNQSNHSKLCPPNTVDVDYMSIVDQNPPIHRRRNSNNFKSPNSNSNTNSNPNFNPNPFFIGPNGQTLLHYACQNHPSPECLQTLLDCLHPSTLLLPDKDGNLPIHMAMTNGASHDALWVLIRNAPHSVHIANRWGYRAWDWVWERCHYELITLARTSASGSTSTSTSTGTCSNSKPHSSTKSNRSKKSSEVESWKQKVWNTIDALVRAAAGEWEDVNVDVNVNMNMKQGANSTSTSTSTRTNTSKRTLLHMIANFDFDCPINLIQAILDEFPSMTSEKDEYGRVPVAHAAAMTDHRTFTCCHDDNDPTCNKHTRSRATMTGANTKIPFTSLMIRMLILANPMALLEEDNTGRIALHMAIDAGKGWKDIVRTMARSAPDGMQKMDPITNLYPVMMLSARRNGNGNDGDHDGGGNSDGDGDGMITATKVEDIYEAMSFSVQVCCHV